jgi:hypothetical protein
MNLRDARELQEELAADPEAGRVYGRPCETTDGTLVIPVAKVGRRVRSTGRTVRPLGVFVVKDGRATWQPAIDAERVALMGILVGLVSATFAGVAMVRRPPWPDLRDGPTRSR